MLHFIPFLQFVERIYKIAEHVAPAGRVVSVPIMNNYSKSQPVSMQKRNPLSGYSFISRYTSTPYPFPRPFA
jgi:hypothetical protein